MPGRLSLFVGSILFASFFWLYFSLGDQVAGLPAQPMRVTDILFDTDVARAVGDMTDPSFPHYRSRVHPLFVLFTNPAGSLLTKILDGRNTLAAVWLTSFFGSLGSLGAFVFFLRASRSVLRSLLASLIFSFSMSKIVFSALPETYSLGILSLLVTYLVFWTDLYQKRLRWSVWALAGVFSLGVTTTNFAQTLLCFALARWARRNGPVSRWAGGVFGFGAGTLAAGAALALLQRSLYPSAYLFFRRSAFLGEAQYASLRLLEHPAEVLGELFKNFFVVNVVAPAPVLSSVGGSLPKISFSGAQDFSYAGWAALLVWLALAVLRMDIGHFRRYGRFYAGAALCLLFNLLLHAFYGFEPTGEIEYFVFSGNFTFLVVAAVLLRWVLAPGRGAVWGLAVFLGLLAMNNLSVFSVIFRTYGGS